MRRRLQATLMESRIGTYFLSRPRHRLPVKKHPGSPFFASGTIPHMGWLQGVMLSYGVFSIAMGLIGYLNSSPRSAASLIAGGIAGLLVIGFAALSKTSPRVGFIGATVVGLILAARFSLKTLGGKVYPDGIIFTVSVIFVLILLGAHFWAVSHRKREAAPEPKPDSVKP
jgi:uncharacterized membrane protein (UPF0136 family)